MKPPLVKVLALASLLGTTAVSSATTIFSDDFSATTLTTAYNIPYGGWYGTSATPGIWYRADATASIVSGQLQASANYGFLSSGVLLLPSAFQSTGAGSYVLNFEITSVADLDSNDVAVASVWSGMGYGAPGNGGDALLLSFGTSNLQKYGSAVVNQLGSTEKTTTGTYSVPFIYDGSSAIAFFLGVDTKGGAGGMPVVRFDNVSLGTVSSAVPEVSGPLGLGLLLGTAMFRRSRKR